MTTPVLVGISSAICVMFTAWLLFQLFKRARSVAKTITQSFDQLGQAAHGMKLLHHSINALGVVVSEAGASFNKACDEHARVSAEISTDLKAASESLLTYVHGLTVDTGLQATRSDEKLAKIEAAIVEFSKYTDGFVKVCESQVAQYEKMSKLVKQFQDALSSPDAGGPSEVQHYDENTADSVFTMQSYMAAGLTPEEAKAKAGEADAMRVFTPATPGY